MDTAALFTFLWVQTGSSIKVPIAKPWDGTAPAQAVEKLKARLKIGYAGQKKNYCELKKNTLHVADREQSLQRSLIAPKPARLRHQAVPAPSVVPRGKL